MTLQARGTPADAVPLAEEARDIFMSMGNAWWTAFTLGLLGKGALEMGDFDRAEAGLLEALAIYRSIGNRWGLALFSPTVARLYLEMGSLQEARTFAEEACALLSEIGHKHVLGWAYKVLGDVAWAEGRVAEAERHHQSSLATYRDMRQGHAARLLTEELEARKR